MQLVNATRANAELTTRLTASPDTAEVERIELAVDFADLVDAARRGETILSQLLLLDVRHAGDADQALEHMGRRGALHMRPIEAVPASRQRDV